MLSHYSPLKVAETFRVLHALFPGRIDLGIGRAPGSDRRTAWPWPRGDRAPSSASRSRWRTWPPSFKTACRPGTPSAVCGRPPSPRRAGAVAPGLQRRERRAGRRPRLGLLLRPLHQPPAGRRRRRPAGVPGELPAHGGPPRSARQPRRDGPCAPGRRPKRARLSASFALMRVRFEQGIWGPVPDLEEALAYPYNPLERARAEAILSAPPSGPRSRCRPVPAAMAREHGVDELVVVTICHDPPPGAAPTSCWRRRSGWRRSRRPEPERASDGRGATSGA